MLKSYGVLVGWVLACSILVSAPVPFVLDLIGIWVELGPRFWGKGLTITEILDDSVQSEAGKLNRMKVVYRLCPIILHFGIIIHPASPPTQSVLVVV